MLVFISAHFKSILNEKVDFYFTFLMKGLRQTFKIFSQLKENTLDNHLFLVIRKKKIEEGRKQEIPTGYSVFLREMDRNVSKF